jgi:hypothetical protein
MLQMNNGYQGVVALPRLVEPQTPLRIASYQEEAPQRNRLEAFIQQVFQQAYDANIQTFYPSLIGITRPDQGFAAVAGIRPAGKQLIAEHYLERPIERLLADRGHLVSREAIVEVGNLAPASAGQARWLIATITAYLHAAGFSWVVFTAVPALHNAFQRMGVVVTPLAVADKDRLPPNEKDSWGRYYDAQPMVYAGSIRAGYHILNQRIGPGMPRLQALWLQAQEEGHCYAQQQMNLSRPALLS